jgi:hypothetical protein
MNTTRDLASDLLALPNVPLCVEGWAQGDNEQIKAKMTGYDPEGTAILVLRPDSLPPRRHCIVSGCSNHTDQGEFVGELCRPCRDYLVAGEIGPTESFLGELAEAVRTLAKIYDIVREP